MINQIIWLRPFVGKFKKYQKSNAALVHKVIFKEFKYL